MTLWESYAYNHQVVALQKIKASLLNFQMNIFSQNSLNSIQIVNGFLIFPYKIIRDRTLNTQFYDDFSQVYLVVFDWNFRLR